VPTRVKPARSPYAAAEKEQQPAPAPKGRVLVIDDDESVHGVLANMLSREGYSTRIARDARKGSASPGSIIPTLSFLISSCPAWMVGQCSPS